MKQNQLKLLRDFVLVEPEIRELSDVIFVSNKEKFNQGRIAAIGPQVRVAKAGDFIKYGNGTYLNWPIKKIEGRNFQIIQESDIAYIVG